MSGAKMAARSASALPRFARGLHDLADLRRRCEVLVGRGASCWLWLGGAPAARPNATIAGKRVCGHLITAVLAGRAAERAPQQRWVSRCGQALCLAPHHLMLADSHGAALRHAGASGRLRRTAAQVEAMRAARLQRPDVSPAWMVQWARESAQPASAVAHALGVKRGTVEAWRQRRRYRPVPGDPLAGLVQMALRGAAA